MFLVVVFVVRGMVMVTCSGSVLFPSPFHLPPPSMSGIFLSLLLLCPLTAATGPVVCFVSHLERCLGALPADFSGAWTPPEYWDVADIALEMSEHPNIWTGGSREDFSSVGGFEVAGAGVYLSASELALDGLIWGTADEYGDARLERCRAFVPVPGVLQTVQCAEFWGAIVAMQAYWPCHLGIDNLNVARTIGRLLDHDCFTNLLPLGKDGDLVALARCMIRTRGEKRFGSLRLKRHAEDVDVQQGRVRLVDQVGNDEADTAADLGRRHQSVILTDARRRLLEARSHRYPILLDLHRFMIAVARVSVNHDVRSGTALDLLVWDQGGRPKARKIDIMVNVDLASLSGPPGFRFMVVVFLVLILLPGLTVLVFCLDLFLFSIPCIGQLVLMTWAIFGVSFLELFFLFEHWAGHRLLSAKVTWPHVTANRPIFISSVPVSEGIEIRHGCQFLSSLVRALAKLPGGLGRFLPCRIGSHMSRLRHLVWKKCSHGLTSGPLESCHHQCLKAVCGVLGYPRGSALDLLDGTLKLRHCTTLFTIRFSPWSLPRVGNGGGKRQFGTPGHHSDPGGNLEKRVWLTRKTRLGVSFHSIPDLVHPTPRRGKRLRLPSSEGVGRRGGRTSQSFSSTWGWVSFAPGDAWNLPS